MFVIKSIFSILLSLSVERNEERWVTLPLAESYEYQILNGKGVWTINQYRNYFIENGFVIHHWEVERDFKRFHDWNELREWVRTKIAPEYDAQEEELFVEQYLKEMEARGWLEFEDHSFGFPRQRLLVLLSKE